VGFGCGTDVCGEPILYRIVHLTQWSRINFITDRFRVAIDFYTCESHRIQGVRSFPWNGVIRFETLSTPDG